MTTNAVAAVPTTTIDLPDAAFAPAPPLANEAERISRPTLTYFQDARRRFVRDKMAMACLTFVALVALIGAVGPLFFPKAVDGIPFHNQQNPNAIDQSAALAATRLLVVDDFASAPVDRIDESVDTSAPTVAAAELTAPKTLAFEGTPTVNGVTLAWTPVAGSSGYQIYRIVTGSGVDAAALAAGTIERGVAIGEVANPAQITYTDALGLDASETYAYTVVPYVDDPMTFQKTAGPAGVVATTTLVQTIKLADAQSIFASAQAGETITDRVHAFGTDGLGRDVLARMIEGTRVDMLLALIVPSLCILIGLIYGAVSGLVGGKTDNLMMRIVEVVDNFPDLLFFIILQVSIGKGVTSLVLALTLFGWAGFARIVRGEVLRLREVEFVHASSLLGAPIMRLVGRHIGPNLLGLVIIAWSARIPSVIASEAFLSMLGLGLEQPAPSWGNVVFDAARRLQVNPLQFFLPASVLGLTLLCFYLIGNSLRDAFDPKLRGQG
jgi:oligopeptide transport system permease protein